MVVKKISSIAKKHVLDKTNIDEKIAVKTKKILDKTNIDDHIIKGLRTIHGEYRKNLVTALSAGLAFIIALYIRDVLQAWIKLILQYIGLKEAVGLFYQTIVALIVVALSVVGIIFLSKWQEKERK